MIVKDLKKFLNLYKDETKLEIKGVSGINWEIRDEMIATKTLVDQKREVCQIYIK